MLEQWELQYYVTCQIIASQDLGKEKITQA